MARQLGGLDILTQRIYNKYQVADAAKFNKEDKYLVAIAKRFKDDQKVRSK